MFYLFLADGFEETEALAPLDMMRRAKIEVKTVGVTGEFVTGSHGVTVKADLKPEEISFNNIDGVVLPGGMPGTVNLGKSETVTKAAVYCAENGKITAIGRELFGEGPIIDAKGRAVLPAFIDLHCHFRTPGFTHKEDLLSGSRAAARVGTMRWPGAMRGPVRPWAWTSSRTAR